MCPLIFLLYVNDDSYLVFTDKNFKCMEENLNTNFTSLCDWFVDIKLGTHFGEDKIKSIVWRNDIKIKQHTRVTYLGCILDNTLSGESMAIKATGKIGGKLKFLYSSLSLLLL